MSPGGFLKAALAIDVALCAVATGLCAAALPGDVVLGVAAGGALGAVNLAGLGWLCARLVRAGERKWPYAVLLALKFAALLLLVFLAIRYVQMDGLAFVVGLSASGVAIVAAAGWVAARKVELTA